jgi:hypothetical protein
MYFVLTAFNSPVTFRVSVGKLVALVTALLDHRVVSSKQCPELGPSVNEFKGKKELDLYMQHLNI